jgi:hypothetical protein
MEATVVAWTGQKQREIYNGKSSQAVCRRMSARQERDECCASVESGKPLGGLRGIRTRYANSVFRSGWKSISRKHILETYLPLFESLPGYAFSQSP